MLLTIRGRISEIWVLPKTRKSGLPYHYDGSEGSEGSERGTGMAVEGFGWPRVYLHTFLACRPNWSLALGWKRVQPQKWSV